MYVIQILIIWIALCVLEPARPHSSAESNRHTFHSPQTKLTRRRISPFRLRVGDDE